MDMSKEEIELQEEVQYLTNQLKEETQRCSQLAQDKGGLEFQLVSKDVNSKYCIFHSLSCILLAF